MSYLIGRVIKGFATVLLLIDIAGMIVLSTSSLLMNRNPLYIEGLFETNTGIAGVLSVIVLGFSGLIGFLCLYGYGQLICNTTDILDCFFEDDSEDDE